MATKTLQPPTRMAVNVRAWNYTRVPNILISLMPQMGEAELRVVMAIARETFGWHRDEESLSPARLRKLTGLSRQCVINGIAEGIRRRVIERRPHRDSFKYRLLVHEEDLATPLDSQSEGSNRSIEWISRATLGDQPARVTGPSSEPNPSTTL